MVSITVGEYLAVIAGLLIVTGLLHLIVKRVAPSGSLGKEHGISTAFLGDDGRSSTSKLQAALWTGAVLWALVSLLVGLGAEAFSEALSGTLGSADPDDKLREEYLLLLGGPYAAAIAAKKITTKRTDGARDSPVKPAKPPATGRQTPWSRFNNRLAEVVTNDEGGIDLGDLQYFAFTLLTLAFFVCAFVADPGKGLPAIPATLLVLMGLSQATYVGKKGLLGDRGAAAADTSTAGATDDPRTDNGDAATEDVVPDEPEAPEEPK